MVFMATGPIRLAVLSMASARKHRSAKKGAALEPVADIVSVKKKGA